MISLASQCLKKILRICVLLWFIWSWSLLLSNCNKLSGIKLFSTFKVTKFFLKILRNHNFFGYYLTFEWITDFIYFKVKQRVLNRVIRGNWKLPKLYAGPWFENKVYIKLFPQFFYSQWFKISTNIKLIIIKSFFSTW